MSGSNLVQSLVRGLEILELAAQSEGGLTLAELASGLGVQRPTAFNLARTLVSKGYLEKTSRPVHYVLGPGVASLYHTQRSQGWRSSAETALRGLFSSLGESFVFIAEPIGGEIQVTFRMDPSRPALVERPAGRVLVPYTMALTLCFQAFWPPAERERYESRYPFVDYGRGVWANRATLDSFLAMSRQRGYVERRSAGRYRIAAPVYGQNGQMIAAIGASRPVGEGEASAKATAAMLEQVQAAAGKLTRS